MRMKYDANQNKLLQPRMELFRLFSEIAIIDQLVRSDAERQLAPDLNMPQFALLSHMIRIREESSLVQLARAMQVTKAAMTNTAGRLAEKNMVAISADPHDKRGKRISVTPAGIRAHQRALELLGQRFDPLLNNVLPAESISQTLATLTVLRTWLDALRLDQLDGSAVHSQSLQNQTQEK